MPADALQVLSQSPRVYIADDFATPEETSHILARGDDLPQLHRAGIKTRHDATGFSFELPVQGDAVLESIRDRLYALLNMPNDFGDTLRFRTYGELEAHPPHLDAFQIGESHLILTALLYLNDTPAGGETTFPRASPEPVKVVPRRGRLLVWFNHTPDGDVDEAAWHEGLPVTEGAKTTVTSFFYRPLSDCALRPRVQE